MARLGLGNIMLLCAEDLYPDPKTYLGFSMCLMKDYQHIPQRSLIEDCALEHAIDFGKLDKCASKDDGAWGVEMLRNSVRRSSDVRCHCIWETLTWGLCLTNSSFSRPESPRAVQYAWTRRSTASEMVENGRTARTEPKLTTWCWRLRRSIALERLEYLSPQFASLAERVTQ